MAKRFKLPKLNRSEKIATLGTAVSLGTAIYALSQSSANGSRSANVDGVTTINKEQLIEAIKGDAQLQILLRGRDGVGGAKGEDGNDGEMFRVDNMVNGDGWNYVKGIEVGNGEVWGSRGQNNNSLTNQFARIERSSLGYGVFNLYGSGVLGIRLLGDGTAYKIGGGSFSAISDERVKDNIQPFERGLSEVLNIDTRSFKYKKVVGTQTEFYPESITSKQQYGVIAQELMQVCPEMVSQDEQGFYSVDLSNLPLILVNAVKEMNAKVTSLEARLAALEQA